LKPGLKDLPESYIYPTKSTDIRLIIGAEGTMTNSRQTSEGKKCVGKFKRTPR